MKKITVVPAILSQTFQEVENIVRFSEGIVPAVQIDICDGSVTPTKTWPCTESGDTLDIRDDFEMPGWDNLDFEVDLYTNKPKKFTDSLVNLGASKIIIHLAFVQKEEFIILAEDYSKYDIEIGIGTTEEIPISLVTEIIHELKRRNIKTYIQVMGIKNVGVQGQEFNQNTIKVVLELHKLFPEYLIQVDGAVTDKNIKSLFEAGARFFVVGSWFEKNNISVEEGVEKLQSLVY